MPGFSSSNAATIASYAPASVGSPQKPKLSSPLSGSCAAAGASVPRRVTTAATTARQDAVTRRRDSDLVLGIGSTSLLEQTRRGLHLRGRIVDSRECTRNARIGIENEMLQLRPRAQHRHRVKGSW